MVSNTPPEHVFIRANFVRVSLLSPFVLFPFCSFRRVHARLGVWPVEINCGPVRASLSDFFADNVVATDRNAGAPLDTRAGHAWIRARFPQLPRYRVSTSEFRNKSLPSPRSRKLIHVLSIPPARISALLDTTLRAILWCIRFSRLII